MEKFLAFVWVSLSSYIGLVDNIMGQDQEQKHVCKLCNKSFMNGRVLGGHMRCHSHKNHNPTKGQKKVSKSNMDIENGIGRHTRYGLREKPKMSWKFSGSNHNTSGQEIVCKVCGKGFESLRALFGHMRHHSGRERSGIYCEECGKGFGSLKALTTHRHRKSHSERVMVCDESWTSSSRKTEMENQSNSEIQGLVRRKRSNRMRYKTTPNSFVSSLNESVSCTEIEQEVEEVAICLMMLSRGIGNWGGFNLVTEFSDNDSVTYEAKSLEQNKRIVSDDGGGIFACEINESLKMKKPRVEEFGSYVSDSKIVSTENDFGFGSDDEKIELEVPLEKFYGDGECKMPKMEDVFGLASYNDKMEKDIRNEMKNKPTEVELEEDFTEDYGLDSANSGSMNFGLNKKAKLAARGSHLRGKSCKKICTSDDSAILSKSNHSWENSEYKCKTCNKNFHSYQALGGHQSMHRTENFRVLEIWNCKTSSQSNIVPETEANFEVVNLECRENSEEQKISRVSLPSYEFKERKEHKCHICFKVFASGQALGGHKRAHLIKNSEVISEETVVIKEEISDILNIVGIDLPIILEEDTNVGVGFKSSWVENDQKHELMGGLIPN